MIQMNTLPSPPIIESYPYERPDFYQCWWKHLASRFPIGQRHEDLLILCKPILKGLVRMNEMRIAGWNNAWSQDLTTERVQQFATFSQAAPWDYFKFTWNNAREQYQDFDALESLGYHVIQVPAPSHYVVDVSQGWDAYLASKNSNQRKNIKKKLRRAGELSPELVQYSGDDAIDTFFEAFFKHHIAYWDTKAGGSYFNHPAERAFILAWAKALSKSGNLILNSLVMNGELANLNLCITSGKTLYSLLTINTGCYMDYLPGLVCQYQRIKRAAEEGYTTLHLGAGDYSHKLQAASSAEPCSTAIVLNPRSFKAKAYMWWLNHRLKKSSEPLGSI